MKLLDWVAHICGLIDGGLFGYTRGARCGDMVARTLWRVVLPLGAAGLVLGLLSGYSRTGWLGFRLPVRLVMEHGALMTGSFFGTMIALERAIALKRWWAYAPPWLCALSFLLFWVGESVIGYALLGIGGVGMVGVFGWLLSYYRYFPFVLMAGAAFLFSGAWFIRLAGVPFVRVLPLLMGFFTLTVVAERLELTRVVGVERKALRWLLAVLAVLVVGIGGGVLAGQWKILGIALGGVGGWLLWYDVALQGLRRSSLGLHRYMAVVLAIGYTWLLVVMAIGSVSALEGYLYDAFVHSFFVGFVFAMVFAHGIMIFPAVMARKGYAWTGWLWVPVLVTQVGLGMRLIGDVLGAVPMRLWGSGVIGVGILLYMGLVFWRTFRLPRAQ